MKTIRFKLTRIITFGIVIILGLSIITINKFIDNSLEKDIKKEMEIVLTYAKENLENAIITGEKNGKFSYLNKVISVFEGYIYFEDHEGKDYAGSYIDGETIESYKKNIRENRETSYLKITRRLDNIVGTLYYPLYIDRDFKGSLIIQRNYTENYRSYIDIRNGIIGFQVLLMLVLIVGVFIIIKRTTKPLEKLTLKVKAFGEGEYLEEEIKLSRDEIGVLAKEFINMERNIRGLQEENKEFFDRATHELKTPLTGIKGYSDLLLEEDFEDEFVITAVERIGEESDKMASLIKNLLILSRKEKDISVYKEEVLVKKTIENILKSMELKILEKGLKIKVQSDEVKIFIFKSDFEVVLNNLITNMIKYSDDKEAVIIFENKEQFTIKTRNKFYGEIQEDIFKPFVKEKSQRDEITSSGLGLYICSEICIKNKWKVEYKIDGKYIDFIFSF